MQPEKIAQDFEQHDSIIELSMNELDFVAGTGVGVGGTGHTANGVGTSGSGKGIGISGSG